MRVTTALAAAVAAGALFVGGAAVERRFALLPADVGRANAVQAPSTVATHPAGVEPRAGGAVPGSTAQPLAAARLAALLAVLDSARREEILATAARFKQFVVQEIANSATVAAAQEHGAGQTPGLALLMERAAQRVLTDSYLSDVVRANLNPGFPSEAQLQEAYDKNPAVFQVPARVHLWQIFIALPKDADADAAAVTTAQARAARLARAARAPKADFSRLAQDESAHEASRLNDGYMGLLKIDELLPPIATAVKTLKVGEVSDPIEAEGGLHIIKRGAVVAAHTLPLAQVREALRQRMVQEATAKVRQAAVDKMTQAYGVPLPGDDRLEAWRLELAQARQATAAPK